MGLILTPRELIEHGFAPKNYGGNKSIQQLGFSPRKDGPDNLWKHLPLVFQIMYTDKSPHVLKSTK